jgi:hypothetical protein
MGEGDPIERRTTGAERPFLFVTGGMPPASRGFAGTVAAVALAVVGFVLFLGVLLVVAAVFVVALAAALCVMAVRGLVHALSPHGRGGPVGPGGFGPASVIESTATVIRRAAPKSRA